MEDLLRLAQSLQLLAVGHNDVVAFRCEQRYDAPPVFAPVCAPAIEQWLMGTGKLGVLACSLAKCAGGPCAARGARRLEAKPRWHLIIVPQKIRVARGGPWSRRVHHREPGSTESFQYWQDILLSDIPSPLEMRLHDVFGPAVYHYQGALSTRQHEAAVRKLEVLLAAAHTNISHLTSVAYRQGEEIRHQKHRVESARQRYSANRDGALAHLAGA